MMCTGDGKMNKNTKKVLGLGIIGLATLGAGSAMVSAMGGMGGFGQSDDIKTAIDNNDYAAFQELTQKDISQEQFEMMTTHAQTRELVETAIEDGDYDAFVDATQDARRGTPSQEQFEDMVQRHQAHEKVEQAMEEKNYDLWLAAVQDLPHAQDMADLISEDEFELFLDMHEAREEGDFDEAQEIADELGLQRPQKQGKGSHQKGMGQHR